MFFIFSCIRVLHTFLIFEDTKKIIHGQNYDSEDIQQTIKTKHSCPNSYKFIKK